MSDNNIKKAFNKAAESYDAYCQLQLSTGKKLISLIQPYAHPTSRIIDLGCGTGIVTRELVAALPHDEFFAIDVADQMIEKARTQLQDYSLTLSTANFDQPLTLGRFNISFSNMALHWSHDFVNTLKQLLHTLTEDGILAFSIPLLGTFAEIESYCAINDFMDSIFVKKILDNSGYHIIQMQTEAMTFEFADFLQALRSIKKIGANYVKKRIDLNYTKIKQAVLSGEQARLTYQIGYFVVKKKS